MDISLSLLSTTESFTFSGGSCFTSSCSAIFLPFLFFLPPLATYCFGGVGSSTLAGLTSSTFVKVLVPINNSIAFTLFTVMPPSFLSFWFFFSSCSRFFSSSSCLSLSFSYSFCFSFLIFFFWSLRLAVVKWLLSLDVTMNLNCSIRILSRRMSTWCDSGDFQESFAVVVWDALDMDAEKQNCSPICSMLTGFARDEDSWRVFMQTSLRLSYFESALALDGVSTKFLAASSTPFKNSSIFLTSKLFSFPCWLCMVNPPWNASTFFYSSFWLILNSSTAFFLINSSNSATLLSSFLASSQKFLQNGLISSLIIMFLPSVLINMGCLNWSLQFWNYPLTCAWYWMNSARSI